MWSSYGHADMLVEKTMVSQAASDPTVDPKLPYVVNDIATFFTLLVGIYFPSVTGKATLMCSYLFISGSVASFIKPFLVFLSLLSSSSPPPVVFSTVCSVDGRLLL